LEKTKTGRVTIHERILDILKNKVGEQVSVKELAFMLNVSERSVRRIMRKIRAAFPEQLTYMKSGGRLVYIFGATPEQSEELKKKLETKRAQKRKRETEIETSTEIELKEVELLEEEIPEEELEEEAEEESEEEKLKKILEP